MYNQLTREQRYAIYLGIQEGRSQRAIARQINVSPSTVSREIRRNSNRFGHYSWSVAQEKNSTFPRQRMNFSNFHRNVALAFYCVHKHVHMFVV